MRKFRIAHLLPCGLILMQSIAHSQNSSSPAGTWVLQLGNRLLLVLSLSADSRGTLSGTLSRPKHFQTNDDRTFSHVQGPIETEPVIASGVHGDSLRFTVQSPADPKDRDSYLLTVIDPMHATLRIQDVALPPMTLLRAPGPAVVSTDWDTQRAYSPDDNATPNADMKRIFDEDQRARQQPVGKINWTVVRKSDAERRAATKKLLDSDKLHSGKDFVEAAYIFQHGDTPNDYLLAHTLALVALAKGESDGLWITAATLDRYLQSTDKPQIYGTQFRFPDDQPTTQDPYDRSLISDALRRELGVPSVAAQEKQLKEYAAERKSKD
jgi:hypothetical protein